MDPRSVLNEARRTWQPPRELQHSCPREVRLKVAGRLLLAVAVICLVGAPVAGALLYVKAAADRNQRRELIANGRGGRAVVTRRWMGKGDHPSYFVDYTYEAGGRSHAGQIGVEFSTWIKLEQGTELPVLYLPLDPRRHLVPGFEDQLTPLWLPCLVAGVAAATGGLITLPLRWQRGLLSEGRPAPGVVLSHKRSQHMTVARYDFMTLSGAIAEGKTEAVKNPPSVGSLLCVMYEQDNARNNRTYPFSLYECE